MNIISSKSNTLVKERRKLKEKKYRKSESMFLIEGFRFVEEALKSDFEVLEVFVNENSLKKLENFNLSDKVKKEQLYVLSQNVFKTLSSTENSQGIIAVVKNKMDVLQNKNGFYILADKIQDPGNMGTIIRTAHASGALGVIVTQGTVDIYNEKTLRSTMGSIFNIPVFEDVELNLVNRLKQKDFKLFSSSLEGTKSMYDMKFKDKKIILAVGNEGNGISEEVYKLSDEKFKIPMPGKAESLNVAVASSIMMFEIVRQNLKNN